MKTILENTFSWGYKLKNLNEATLTRGELLKKLKNKRESQVQQQIKDELADDEISAQDHLQNIMLDKDSLVEYYNKLYNEMESKLRAAIEQEYIKKGEDPNDPEVINFIDEYIEDIIEHPEAESNVKYNKRLSFGGVETSDDDDDWSEEAIDRYLKDDTDDPTMTTKDFSAIAKWKRDPRTVADYTDKAGVVHKGKGIPKFI